MKTFKIETEDRYGRFNEYKIEAESLELATAKAKSAKHYIFDVSEVRESTQKIEDAVRVVRDHRGNKGWMAH